MSNGEFSNLKRGANAAFGQESDQKAGKPKRKRSKAPKFEQKAAHDTAIAQPESTFREVQHEPLVTQDPAEIDQNGKKIRHKRSKTSRRRQKPVQDSELALLERPLPDFPDRPILVQQPSNTGQKIIDIATHTTNNHGVQSGVRDERKLSRNRLGSKERSTGSGWTITAADGGRFANHDPILVQSDRYLILAVRTQILVYSTVTSLLLRSLRILEHDKISSYVICGINNSHLFVSTYSGVVLKWDWTTGREIKRWKSSQKLLCIAKQLGDQTSQSASLLLIHEDPNQDRRLTWGLFSDSSDDITEELILDHNSVASWIKVLDEGRCLVMHAGNKLLLGQATRKAEGTPAQYLWREVELPQSITSIDARGHNLSSRTNENHFAVDVVIGCLNGSVLIYDDVLFRLMSKEKNPSEDDVVARRFHWHRREVLTVKWSLDGNYIISGGHETVMVIWQLDTGQQQFLPHLSAAIQHLAVSQTGAAYAVHLADNSVMVLSTSELQPTAYVCGLALKKRRWNEKKAIRTPAVLDHNDSTTMLLAVPADDPVQPSIGPKATLLQSYDIHLQQQSNRQALVRNNITALNVGPMGNNVQEPDVTYIKISHNGNWLATIDEWTLPEQDSVSVHITNDDSPLHSKEIFLKFWARNNSTRSWELVTKVADPHSTRTNSSVPVLDLQENPHRTEFSTISSDGTINIWTPKSRHRDGVPVKDKSGSKLYTWTCSRTIEISLSSQYKSSIRTGKMSIPICSLAYSPDGSVLATSSNVFPYIHFIDPITGQIHHTQSGSNFGPFSALTFLNHHLITISKDLRVHNTVNADLLYALALSSEVSNVLLAANELDGTFAVVLQVPLRKKGSKGREEPDGKDGKEEKAKGKERVGNQIVVFDLNHAAPIFRKIVDGSVEVLLSLQQQGDSGYVIVNGEAEVMYIRSKTYSGSLTGRKNADSLPTPLLLEERKMNSLEEIFGPRRLLENGDADTNADNTTQRTVAQADADADAGLTHKTHSSLAEVFNRSTNLPVRDLFEQVVAVLYRAGGSGGGGGPAAG